MGMFDTLKCKYPMPHGYEFLQNEEFQTKDFDNVLDKYTITKEGGLVHHNYVWDFVPEEERPFYGKPEWDTNPLFRTMGSLKTIHVGDKEMDFHGYIRFYTSIKDKDGYKFYELQAKFTDGKLVDLKMEMSK
jgi:hypothetical protein